MSIHELLAAVMADVTSVGKGDRNDFHKFMFRGIDRVINEVGPVLRKHRVVVIPHLDSLDSRDVQTEKGKTSREVTVQVTYTFYGPDGDSLAATVPGEAADTGDKAVSKAMSVAYRTALIQTLTIPTEQRDPDSQVYTRTEGNLIGWKKKIMAEAESRRWDVEVLAQAFAEWSHERSDDVTDDIREADESLLAEYYKHLVPPRTARRQPVDGAS